MKYLPTIYRMRVLWVEGTGIARNDFKKREYHENIWILKLWGNPRDIACNRAMFWARIFNNKPHLNRFNCVSAGYNPIDWSMIKYKIRNFGI